MNQIQSLKLPQRQALFKAVMAFPKTEPGFKQVSSFRVNLSELTAQQQQHLQLEVQKVKEEVFRERRDWMIIIIKTRITEGRSAEKEGFGGKTYSTRKIGYQENVGIFE